VHFGELSAAFHFATLRGYDLKFYIKLYKILITVQQATEIIMKGTVSAPGERVKLHDALGRRLAEVITCDRDLPPFHRSTMDGIAIAFNQFLGGQRTFALEGIQAAGQPQIVIKDFHNGVEIMTGGMLPNGLDTVIRYEDITVDNGKATINVDSIEKGQSIHRKGIDAKEGEEMLQPGQYISPAEVALLASVGRSEVMVLKNEPVAIVSTGDELVDIDNVPQQWQIRKSNGSALAAALQELNIPSQQFHLPDDPNALEKDLKKILSEHCWVIITGGVSKGKFDYVPSTLAKLGVEKLFHQVKQRPGKPLWFGRSLKNTVFALPGNPVSTFMCFYRYVKPAITSIHEDRSAILGADFNFKPDLTYFLQVRVAWDKGQLIAHPIPGEGSGDFANLRNVDGFIELPSERSEFKKGEAFPYYPFRNR
jgi:molybdopterin molybdotransferase